MFFKNKLYKSMDIWKTAIADQPGVFSAHFCVKLCEVYPLLGKVSQNNKIKIFYMFRSIVELLGEYYYK